MNAERRNTVDICKISAATIIFMIQLKYDNHSIK